MVLPLDLADAVTVSRRPSWSVEVDGVALAAGIGADGEDNLAARRGARACGIGREPGPRRRDRSRETHPGGGGAGRGQRRRGGHAARP